jgi:hypothetical protein
MEVLQKREVCVRGSFETSKGRRSPWTMGQPQLDSHDRLLIGGADDDSITVTFGSPTRIADATAPLRAVQGCIQVDPHVVTCDTFAFGLTGSSSAAEGTAPP